MYIKKSVLRKHVLKSNDAALLFVVNGGSRPERKGREK